jgi:hypothetical protein
LPEGQRGFDQPQVFGSYLYTLCWNCVTSTDPGLLPSPLRKALQGSIVLGMGFSFDDSGSADDDTPGIPSPIATMERLIAENPINAEVIFPYIGGEEECWREWPEWIGIGERKVKGSRGSHPTAPWSQFERSCGDL